MFLNGNAPGANHGTSSSFELDRLKEVATPQRVAESRGVSFKPDGSGRIKGRCPLPSHGPQTGETPPFTVYEGGGWKCFGCNAGGGDGIDLEQAITGSDFPTAARALTERFGLQVNEVSDHGFQPRTAETYPYQDVDGQFLFEVVRFQPKDFRQRRRGENGEWIWKLDGTRRVLYNMPGVVAAVTAGETVWVVEGEKDVNNLIRLGLPATTNPGGALKWRDQYSESLRGAKIVILPDNDQPGREHAEQVAHFLVGAAREIKIVDLPGLPEKGDVSDWIAEREEDGKGPEEIRATLQFLVDQTLLWDRHRGPHGAMEGPKKSSALYASTAPLWEARCLADVQAEEVEFLWQPYIPLGKITILEGDPGEGKSTIMAAIATSGSLGMGLPGMEPFEPFKTLIFSAEDHLADTLRPRLDRLEADCSWIFAHDQPLALSGKDALAQLEREIARLEPRLVVIDPIVAYLGGKVDTYRANEVRSVLAPLAGLAEQYRCAIVIVRHLTKARAGRSLHAGQGSVDFVAAARSVLLAGSAPNDRDLHALIHNKSNLAKLGPSLGYEIQNGRFLWVGETSLTARDLLAAETPMQEVSAVEEAEKFLVDLLAAEPLPANDVLAAANQAGIAERTLKRAKKNAGIVIKREGFGRGSYVLWSLPGHRRPNDSIEDREGSPAPNGDTGPLWGTAPLLTPPAVSSPEPDAKGDDSAFDAATPTQAPPTPIVRNDGNEEFLL
jgi:putative DNA primase/helicase